MTRVLLLVFRNFTIWHQDADDSEDLGNWVVQQPWSNGQIFTIGASADGLAAFTTVHKSPSWLKAQYYIWTSSIGYDVFFPGGAFVEELADSWIHGTVEFPEGWSGMMQYLFACSSSTSNIRIRMHRR
jgi:predicted acyl esterase